MLRIHSDLVMPGDTFLALRGVNDDGHNYIKAAIDKGATCVIAQEGDYPVKTIIEKDTRAYLAKYLNELYADKLKKIELIAIGGVSGKTSTAYLTYQLLNSLNFKCAYIGALGFYVDDEKKELQNRTPDLYELYELITEAVNKECEYLIIEVSEEAMYQRRLEGLKFKYVAITNTLNNESVMQNTSNANILLLDKVKRYGYAIINADDPSALNLQLEKNRNILFGIKKSDYQINDIHLYEDHSIFKLNTDNKMTEITLNLPGKFNIYNYLIAYIIASLIGAKVEDIILATAYLKQASGRYQIFKKDDSTVIVDNAGGKRSITNVVENAKFYTPNRIIILIGGKGNQSKEEHNNLGKIALEHSDYVIFTTDSPYREKPEEIINDMTRGLDESKFEIILDRKEAIKKGINILNPGDTLLVLGRGNDNYQIIDNEKFPFNDVNEVTKWAKSK